MTFSIEQALQKELGRVDEFNGQGMERKFPLVRVNGKTPMFARILPLGDKWLACRFDQAYIDVNGFKGMVTLTSSNPDNTEDDDLDELATLCNKAVALNKEYKKIVGNTNAPDLIDLAPGGRYGFRIKHSVEVVGVPVIKSPQGSFQMANSQTGNGLAITNYVISLATYLNIIDKLRDNYMINGQSFDTPLQFITEKASYPLSIKIARDRKSYDVDLRTDIPLPAINYNYLEKDASGNYKYIDDPYMFNKPTRVASPSRYNQAIQAIKPIIEAGEEKIRQMSMQGMQNQGQSQGSALDYAQSMSSQAPHGMQSNFNAGNEPLQTHDTGNDILQAPQPMGNQAPAQAQSPDSDINNSQSDDFDPFDGDVPVSSEDTGFGNDDFDVDFDF